MKTETVTITRLIRKELRDLLQPYFVSAGVDLDAAVDTFGLTSDRLFEVASGFELDGPGDGTLEEVIVEEVGRYWSNLAAILAMMAGLGLIPKTDYLIG